MKKYDLIYFIGDSYTVGVGQNDDLDKVVTLENRFSTLVSKHFNLKEVNQAVAGCGNLYVLYQLTKDILSYKKDGLNPLVVVGYTFYDRVEFYNPKRQMLEPLNILDEEIFKTFLTKFYDRHFNIEMSNLFILSIQSILSNNNIDFIEHWVSDDMVHSKHLMSKKSISDNLIDIAAIDGTFKVNYGDGRGHANVIGNQRISEKIITKIEELYN